MSPTKQRSVLILALAALASPGAQALSGVRPAINALTDLGHSLVRSLNLPETSQRRLTERMTRLEGPVKRAILGGDFPFGDRITADTLERFVRGTQTLSARERDEALAFIGKIRSVGRAGGDPMSETELDEGFELLNTIAVRHHDARIEENAFKNGKTLFPCYQCDEGVTVFRDLTLNKEVAEVVQSVPRTHGALVSHLRSNSRVVDTLADLRATPVDQLRSGALLLEVAGKKEGKPEGEVANAVLDYLLAGSSPKLFSVLNKSKLSRLVMTEEPLTAEEADLWAGFLAKAAAERRLTPGGDIKDIFYRVLDREANAGRREAADLARNLRRQDAEDAAAASRESGAGAVGSFAAAAAATREFRTSQVEAWTGASATSASTRRTLDDLEHKGCFFGR